MLRRLITALSLAVTLSAVAAAPGITEPDTVSHARGGLIGKVIEYFEDSNKPRPEKRFDLSFIGGPHYASDTKFGIGIVAAGNYRTSVTDTVTPRSDIAVTADVSTSGFYMLGLRGNHRMDMDRRRIVYDFSFYSFPTYFWGIGYDAGRHGDDLRSKYLEFSFGGNISYLATVAHDLFIGPAFGFKWLRAKNAHKPELWQGQQMKTVCLGLGLTLRYDNRDNLTAPTRGFLATLEQRFYPKFMAAPYAFASIEVEAAAYRGVWRGCVLAARIHGKFCYGRVPWSMLATFGGSYSMRAYYEGRYRDYDAADITIELRQHIHGRSGVALWVGAASVFPRLEAFTVRHLLPEAGIGYRWEFKQYCNVRLDYGIGRGSSGFVFSINEAF